MPRLTQPEAPTLSHRIAMLALALAWGGFQLLYTLSPIDLLPDVIPVLGWLDDLVGLLSSGAMIVWSASKVVQHPSLQPQLHGDPPESLAYEPLAPDEVRRW